MPTYNVEGPVYCPRCDRLYPNLEAAKTHVAKQHPDHDPEWWDTHPSDDDYAHEQGIN